MGESTKTAMDKEDQKKGQMEALGTEILKNCRNELYRLYPSLDAAFGLVMTQPSDRTGSMAGDGRFFYFSPEFVADRFVTDPPLLCRGYLHMLLHCLFGHIFPEQGVSRRIWDLACDMAVEYLVGQESEKTGAECLKQNGAGSDRNRQELRSQCFRIMGEGLSAWKICRMLEQGAFPFPAEEMEATFVFDDHALWYQEDERERSGLKRAWEKARSRTGGEGGAFGSQAGSQAGDGEETLDEIYRSRYDYRRFLRQFAHTGEEMELDMESFDYIYYTLGMERYGNLPLIEPLEYREVNRLAELVIAIDTSGSCSARTVSRFLGETWEILSEQENFFERMKVLFIQCDCCIQDVAEIHSRQEWEAYARNVTIRGRAGTDFCPVFRYIEKRREAGELQNLAALIYFTDGDGVYPREKPDYETAFVFVKKTKGMDQVPAWARRLLIECQGG